MEQTPADARAAPSASEPNDTVMDIHSSPKRPRESAQGNMVRAKLQPQTPHCHCGVRASLRRQFSRLVHTMHYRAGAHPPTTHGVGPGRKRDKLKTITDANAPWGHSGNL
eukprot:scaffold1938_cov113-Isochrysis_galbana.AAC.4